MKKKTVTVDFPDSVIVTVDDFGDLEVSRSVEDAVRHSEGPVFFGRYQLIEAGAATLEAKVHDVREVKR